MIVFQRGSTRKFGCMIFRVEDLFIKENKIKGDGYKKVVRNGDAVSEIHEVKGF